MTAAGNMGFALKMAAVVLTWVIRAAFAVAAPGTVSALGQVVTTGQIREVDVDASQRVVGAGFIGGVHARAIRTNGHRLAGVAAASAERSREDAAALSTRANNDADKLVGAADIKVVDICTPDHLHAPLGPPGTGGGHHVVVEKPVAVSATEAAELVEVWRGTDSVVAVPFVYRFYPTVREARGRLAAGWSSASDPRFVRAGLMATPGDADWRMDSMVGGPSRAFGGHGCDLGKFVTGAADRPRESPDRVGCRH